MTALHASCRERARCELAAASVADVLVASSDDSVSSILNADGSTLVNESYTAYGDRRNPTTCSGSASSDDLSVSAGVTRQGYTWQTSLGNMGLNHMNGRVQDAITGVFLSPDPYISEPGNPQNYNRYSYVYNNPMSHTDPSGFVTIGYGSCEPECEEVIVTATYSHNGEYYPGDWFQNYGHFLPDQNSLFGNNDNFSVNGASIKQPNLPPATKVTEKTSVVAQKKELNPLQQFKNLFCMLPQGAGSAGVDAYNIFGGSIAGGGSFNPRNGQISISFDLGAGVGFGEAETIELGTVKGIGKPSNEASSIFTGGVNLNGTILFGGKGASGSYQLIGANNGDWSGGGTGSTSKGLMVNTNISAHVQVNLPPLWSCGVK